jgi:hypothetical protein
MIYQGSFATLFDGRYLRTCIACHYTDATRVKMIAQL